LTNCAAKAWPIPPAPMMPMDVSVLDMKYSVSQRGLARGLTRRPGNL
jgi:hypothetical protein